MRAAWRWANSIDRTTSDVPLSKGPYIQENNRWERGEGYGLFEQWISRIELRSEVPRGRPYTSRRTGMEVFDGDAVVVICPQRSVGPQYIERLVRYVKQEGGKLLVTDCHSTHGTFLMHHAGKVRAIKQELVSALDTLRFGTVSMLTKELLQAIHLKYPPVMNSDYAIRKASPAAPMPMEGVGVMRCGCGAVKVKNKLCEVCGA